MRAHLLTWTPRWYLRPFVARIRGIRLGDCVYRGDGDSIERIQGIDGLMLAEVASKNESIACDFGTYSRVLQILEDCVGQPNSELGLDWVIRLLRHH